MAKIYATRNSDISEREKRNMERARKIAAQGMVLLENDGVLPLKADGRSLAVFGSGVRRTVKGGTGSGDVNSRSVYTVEQGLAEAGFAIGTKSWLDRYDKACEEHMASHMQRFTALLQEKGQAAILDALENPYRDPDVPEITEADMEGTDRSCAVYVIARTSGEGSDRKVAPGDYELSTGEIGNLETLAGAYGKVVVVLNTGGVIDTKFFRAMPKIQALLLMSQLGNISGLALADVLTGKVTPSGRLAATWAENYGDYPCADSFSYRNGDVADEYYHEGIFVGYRYFDSFGIQPAYPFGFGRSYTDFSIKTECVNISGQTVCVEVRVRNTGTTYSGRGTVQVYVSQPQGKLSKPYQVLAGFAKSNELAPGQEETVSVTFSVSSLASYDENCAAWLLEHGIYYVRVGANSRATHIAAGLRLGEDVVTEQVQNRVEPDCVFETLKVFPENFFTYPEETQEKNSAAVLDVFATAIPTRAVQYSGEPCELTNGAERFVTMADVLSGTATLDSLTAQLTDVELAELCVGTSRGGFGSVSVIGAASTACPGAAGDTTSALLEARGVVNLVLADGPAGLRLSRSFVADKDDNVIPGLGESALGGVEKLWR